MAVDNAVMSGNLLIEIDETNLVPGQDLSVYPRKYLEDKVELHGQAIFGTKFPNVANENMQLFDKARVLADESTGLPSFAHGQTGVMGVGRTASGISMLMNAASGGIKNVIKNVDDYLLRPLGEGLFRFNMQFNFDNKMLKGDLEVKARGTESLMANEVRSQRLMQFLQVASNQSLAPFAKFQYVIREIAKSLDLDPDKVTNNMDEAVCIASRDHEKIPTATATTADTSCRSRSTRSNWSRWCDYRNRASTVATGTRIYRKCRTTYRTSYSASSSHWSTTRTNGTASVII